MQSLLCRLLLVLGPDERICRLKLDSQHFILQLRLLALILLQRIFGPGLLRIVAIVLLDGKISTVMILQSARIRPILRQCYRFRIRQLHFGCLHFFFGPSLKTIGRYVRLTNLELISEVHVRLRDIIFLLLLLFMILASILFVFLLHDILAAKWRDLARVGIVPVLERHLISIVGLDGERGQARRYEDFLPQLVRRLATHLVFYRRYVVLSILLVI